MKKSKSHYNIQKIYYNVIFLYEIHEKNYIDKL